MCVRNNFKPNTLLNGTAKIVLYNDGRVNQFIDRTLITFDRKNDQKNNGQRGCTALLIWSIKIT